MANLFDFNHEASFVTQVVSGLTDFDMLFPGITFKVDDEVRLWLSGDFMDFKADELVCDVYDPLGTHRLDDRIIDATGLELIRPNRSNLWAILHYLSLHKDDGAASFFNVPEDEEEVRFILGYMYFDGTLRVIEIEHEKEEGSAEAVHIHAEELNRERERWSTSKLLVIKKVQ
jgi:hypothetical protein